MNYANVMQVGIAMLVIVGTGLILGKLKIFRGPDVGIINRYVFKCNFIPLMGRSIMRKNLKELNFMPLADSALTAGSSYVVSCLALAMPSKDRLAMFLSFSLPSIYINFVIAGLPVFNAIWDPEEGAMVSILTLAGDLIVVPIYLIVSEYRAMRKKRKELGESAGFDCGVIKGILIRLITSPVLLGDCVGFLYAGTGLKVPLYLTVVTELMGDVVIPLSLLSVGIFLAQRKLIACHWLKFTLMLIFRHIVSPGLACIWAVVLGFSGKLVRQCTVMTASSSAVACYLITEQSGLGSGAASTMIFWSTILYVPMMLAWCGIFDAFGWFEDE